MTVICPTITVETPEEYERQLTRIQPFAKRVHIDIADDRFTPRKSLALTQIYFPATIRADIHAMLQNPAEELMTLISLRPQLVILHAESDGDIGALMQELQKVHIKAGVALLPQTSVDSAAMLIAEADHVLIFAGHLGFQGGHADMSQLEKVAHIKSLKPEVEIAWDGGVNESNAAEFAAAGVDVLNVGGFIHKADDAAAAYGRLATAVQPQDAQA